MDKFRVGRYIKNRMKEYNIKQNELAQQLDISEQAVSRNLNGLSMFRNHRLVEVASILNVTVDDILQVGEPIEFQLRAYASKPIKLINTDHVPHQPDSNGKTLLDYVLEQNDVHKFEVFYRSECFIESLYNNIEVLLFLIRNNHLEYWIYNHDSIMPDHSISDSEFIVLKRTMLFPKISYFVRGKKDKVSCSEKVYVMLKKDEKKYFDTLMNCRNTDTLDFVFEYSKYKYKDKSLLFYLAIERNQIFFIKYFKELQDFNIDETHINHAILFDSKESLGYLSSRM